MKDDGTIKLNGDDLDLYRKLMLYVVAKRMAYEDRFIDAPEVTIEDINDRSGFEYNKIEIMLFLREARNWLVPADDQAPSVSSTDYADLDDIAFTVNTRSLSDIVDWILEDVQPHPPDVSYGLNNAGVALSVAENQYDKAQKQGADQYSADTKIHYSQVRQKVKRACIDANQYPVLFKRDMAWTEFTEYAEALLDFMDEGYPGKISYYLPKMQRFRETMEKKAEEAEEASYM